MPAAARVLAEKLLNAHSFNSPVLQANSSQ
jgi:hypothetical protein